MNGVDRLLQEWRIAKTVPYIQPGARVLDVGSSDGALFARLGSRVAEGIGIDPGLDHSVDFGRWRLIAGRFPDGLPDQRPFDAIVMLAVLEHVPADQQVSLALDCSRFLRPGGRLIATVPSPRVDAILAVLTRLRILDGMSLHEHYGFDARKTPSLLAVGGLHLLVSRKFQFGLNNLFVFEKMA